MASWRSAPQALDGSVVLERVAGLPEDRLTGLAWNGPARMRLQERMAEENRILG